MKIGLSATIGLAVLASIAEAITYDDWLVEFKDQDNCLKMWPLRVYRRLRSALEEHFYPGCQGG